MKLHYPIDYFPEIKLYNLGDYPPKMKLHYPIDNYPPEINLPNPEIKLHYAPAIKLHIPFSRIFIILTIAI